MKIAIVGAGFSGSTLAIELVQKIAQDTSFSLILLNDQGQPGTGIAYGQARPEHLLNVRAADMGACADNKADFAEALALDEAERRGFLPRLRYGDYLHRRIAETVSRYPQHLSLVSGAARSITRTAQGGFVIQRADNAPPLHCDVVVLATGALPPLPLTGVAPALLQSPAYIASPWQDGALDHVPATGRVLIVGAGLTMADIVLSLHQRGFHGTITTLSRRGLAPLAHTEQPAAPVTLPEDVRAALAHARVRPLAHALIRAARKANDWRPLIDAMRPHTQDFWQSLDASERARFIRHLAPYWDIHRHRLAPGVDAHLHHARQQGCLQSLAARLVEAHPAPCGGVDVRFQARGQQTQQTAHFDVLIRATGLETQLARTPHPLLAQLRDDGLVQGDALGLGLRVDAQLRTIGRDGKAVAGLYYLGPLLRADFWELIAVPDLRVAARDLARHLAERADKPSDDGGLSQHTSAASR